LTGHLATSLEGGKFKSRGETHTIIFD